jgi:hypothetical protein
MVNFKVLSSDELEPPIEELLPVEEALLPIEEPLPSEEPLPADEEAEEEKPFELTEEESEELPPLLEPLEENSDEAPPVPLQPARAISKEAPRRHGKAKKEPFPYFFMVFLLITRLIYMVSKGLTMANIPSKGPNITI